MNIKERILSFVAEFDIHFKKHISEVLTQQQEFHSVAVSLDKTLQEHVLAYAHGGKRIRPFLLSYLSGKDLNDNQVLMAGISIELFHLMALIHDDIMDQSLLRRGVATIHKAVGEYEDNNSRLGEDIAILLGDSFLVASLDVAHSLPTEIFKDITMMMQRTNRGQYLDSFGMNEAYGTTDPEVIAARSELKTAWYTFGTPALIGLKLSGHSLSQEELNTIVSIFVDIGILYQIRDDILDCRTSNGKEAYGDIKENQTTWVTLYLKNNHPKVFNQLLTSDRTNIEEVGGILDTVVFDAAYQIEFEKRIKSVELIKGINTQVYTQAKEILDLLHLE